MKDVKKYTEFVNESSDYGTICKSHVTALRTVATRLAMKQKMNYTQLILGQENTAKIEEAEQLIYKAMNILKTID